jgi:hypothetical protein
MLSQLKEQLSSAKSQQDKFIESLQKQQGEEMAQEKARLEAQLRHVEAVDETLQKQIVEKSSKRLSAEQQVAALQSQLEQREETLRKQFLEL